MAGKENVRVAFVGDAANVSHLRGVEFPFGVVEMVWQDPDGHMHSLHRDNPEDAIFSSRPARKDLPSAEVETLWEPGNEYDSDAGLTPEARQEIRREREQIEARAKANGTYHKAPNGKQSNLTPAQWVTVRTQRFKKWFGDWELAESSEFILNGKPVSELTGKEFAKNDKSIIDNVLDFFNSIGNKVNVNGIGEVTLNKQSIKDSISHGFGRNKAIAFKAVPEILKDGRIVDQNENWKGRGYASYTISAPITINGERHVAFAIVNEAKDKSGNFFYLHEVVLQKSLQSEEFKTGSFTRSPQGDIAKLARKIVNAKENSSQVIDENGEPLVVYHGTSADFNTFQPPIYATPDSGYAHKIGSASDAGGNIMPLFMNIRNIADASKFRNRRVPKEYFLKWLKDNGVTPKKIGKQLYKQTIESITTNDLPAFVFIRDLTDVSSFALKKAGIDGIKLIEGLGIGEIKDMSEAYVALSSTQIKSATANQGTFDGNNPDSLQEPSSEYNTPANLFGDINKSSLPAEASAQAGLTPEAREEIRREREQIEARAKANGTYHKAPNGKQSNLTPAQWVTVRTQRFKKWFGDWELAARIEKLRNSTNVEVTGNEYQGKYELKQQSAEKWMLANLRGEYTIQDTNEKVQLVRSSAKKVLSHSHESTPHLKSIAIIPELISKATFIQEMPSEKSGRFDSYRYYATGLKMGDNNYTVKIIIGVKDGKKYYDHSLTEIEKGKLIDLVNQPAPKSFKPKGENLSSALIKDTRLQQILQIGEVSQVIDENGEPLVVYHGTGDSFNNFSLEKIGANHKKLSIGFNFTSNAKLAGAYARKKAQPNIIPVFLAVKNPIRYTTVAPTLSIDANKDKFVKQVAESRKKDNPIDGIIAIGEDINRHTHVVVFSSTQIKSVTGNQGTFDANNPSIVAEAPVFYSPAFKDWFGEWQLERDLVSLAGSTNHTIDYEKLKEIKNSLGTGCFPSRIATDQGTGISRWYFYEGTKWPPNQFN